MAFFTLFWAIFWRQMLSSILSFVQNPLYTVSNYTKMSLKNSQAVKNLDFVDALVCVDFWATLFRNGYKSKICLFETKPRAWYAGYLCNQSKVEPRTTATQHTE